MGSAADESPNIGAIYSCFRFLNFGSIFKPQCSEGEWGRKSGQNFALFDPLGKIGEGWWRGV